MGKLFSEADLMYIRCQVVLITLVLSLSGCAAIKRAQEAAKVRQAAVSEAKAACYPEPAVDVYNAVFSVVASHHSVARESESRGFIETEWRTDTGTGSSDQIRVRFSVDIVGESCSRVVLKSERQLMPEGESDWQDAGRNVREEDDLYLEIHARISGGASQEAS